MTIKKKRAIILAAIAVALIAIALTLWLNAGRMLDYINEKQIPQISVSEGGGLNIAARRFDYQWNKVIACGVGPTDVAYEPQNTITIGPNHTLVIAAQKQKQLAEASVIEIKVYHSDGTEYAGETDSSYYVDAVHIQSPDKIGDYVYSVYLEFPRGNVTYGFRVAVALDFDALYQQKQPYIGRLPAELAEQLSLPGGWRHIGYQQHTTETPFGLQEYLWAAPEKYDSYAVSSQKADLSAFERNALFYLALIDNCEFVQYTLKYSDGEPEGYGEKPISEIGEGGADLIYDIAWANEYIGGDIKKAADSRESFEAFARELTAKGLQ
ncbi:MAG: DUF4825 domain-containing protein [Oscillospiraceae bacterium]|jgi:hypothetical protein|nr:DUF4825 domain-containing protein [Oscillospiraceae bacterium]